MADPWTITAPRAAVAESVGGSTWSVTESEYALPAALAPSIVVHAEPRPVPKARPSVLDKLDLGPDVRRVAPAPPRPPRRRAVIAPR